LNRLDFWIEKKFRKQLKEAKTELGIFGYSIINTQPVRDEKDKWFVLLEYVNSDYLLQLQFIYFYSEFTIDNLITIQ